MEPKIIEVVFSVIAVPFALIGIFGDIGVFVLDNWKLTVFSIIAIIFSVCKLYWYNKRKIQEHKLRDLDIKEREDKLNKDIFS